MIPKNITRKHILKALEEIDKNGVPAGRSSKKYHLLYKGRLYPPKYVVALANYYANGYILDSESFGGGSETNNFLRSLGFEIVESKQGIQYSKEKILSRRLPTTIKRPVYGPKKKADRFKENIKTMLEKLYGTVYENYKFNVGVLPEDFVGTRFYEKLKEIFVALQEYRGHTGFVRTKTLPQCDYYIPNPGFIVEIDEFQHFTAPRKITLQHYPKDLSVGFSIEKWISLCSKINAKDNDPPFRDEQRAWYDTLRDFLPGLIGLRPTVRIYSKDVKFVNLDPNNSTDVARFKMLLESRKNF